MIDVKELNKQLVKKALKLGKANNMGKIRFDLFTSSLYAHTQKTYHATVNINPLPKADPTRIDLEAREWKKCFVILLMDKNGGHPWVMSRHLFLNLLHDKFSDKGQFEHVQEYPTPKDTSEGTMRLIANLASKHGLREKFSFTPGKAPPHAFMFLKNKSKEEIKTCIFFPISTTQGRNGEERWEGRYPHPLGRPRKQYSLGSFLIFGMSKGTQKRSNML